MIRVMHIITDMKIGGAGSWLLNFLRNYDKKKLDIKVVVPKDSILKEEINKLGVEAIEILGIGDKSFDIGSVNAFTKLFQLAKPQIVHTHASLSARIAAKLCRVGAIIHTKHCLDAPKTGFKRSLAAVINNQLSSKVIAVSEAVKQNLIEAGTPEDRITVIYGGVDELKVLPKEAKEQVRRLYEIEAEDIVFGMSARLAEVKGHKYLIEAAEIALKQKNNIKFVIMGTGPLEEQLKQMVADKGLEKNVVFTGFIKDVEPIYNIFDVNMITSKSEALCLSLIEGMSLGKPMIGTAVGGVPELIQDGQTGILVPPAQSESLAAAILKLAESKELRSSMGNKARELMKEKFAADKMAEEINKLYEDVVQRRRA